NAERSANPVQSPGDREKTRLIRTFGYQVLTNPGVSSARSRGGRCGDGRAKDTVASERADFGGGCARERGGEARIGRAQHPLLPAPRALQRQHRRILQFRLLGQRLLYPARV